MIVCFHFILIHLGSKKMREHSVWYVEYISKLSYALIW
jgi:hypothetical protein